MRKLDFYGTNYTLNTLSKTSFKSTLSLVLSIFTSIVLGILMWLIGREFFFNLNPKVINSTFVPPVSKPAYVNNSNFTIAFRIEDDNERPVPEERLFAFPHIGYYTYSRTAGHMELKFGKIYSPVKCSEIEHNPLLNRYNPETLYCLDLNQINRDLKTSQDIPLYGDFREDFVSSLYIVYTNCKYKNGEIDRSSCISHDKAMQESSNFQYFSIYIPRTSFSPENYENPVESYYENIFFILRPQNSVIYKLKYSFFTLSDDKGWIFEDIHSSVYFDLHHNDKNFGFNPKETFSAGTAYFVSVEVHFQRLQLKSKRVYVKVQELAANLGGLLKLIFFVFGNLVKLYHNFKIESILIEKHYKTGSQYNRSIAQTSISELKLSFLDYVKIKLNFETDLLPQKKALDWVSSKLDVENCLRVCLNLKTNSCSMIRIENNSVISRESRIRSLES